MIGLTNLHQNQQIEQNDSRHSTGFTIIEVVLVLAIAGLIFLMVLIALPALQRNQRNAQYKNNVAMAAALTHSYMSNNQGDLPPAMDGDASGYITGRNNPFYQSHPLRSYIDSAGFSDGISFKVWPTGASGRTLGSNNVNSHGRIVIITNGTCSSSSGEGVGFRFDYAAGRASVMTVLEPGRFVYCQNV